jgi:starch phosphorylase
MIAVDPICGMPVDVETAVFKAEIWGEIYYFCSEGHRRRFLEGHRIAYFSMEVGIESSMPTYSGGLGVLAGDCVRSSADLRIPLVAVTLVSRKGYFRQEITEWGDQREHLDDWDPSTFMRLLPDKVTVLIDGSDINFSILDGWWIEGCIEGVVGWAIGPRPVILIRGREKVARAVRSVQ